MKVLVTGATGFLGRHVTAQLVERQYEVIAVARNEQIAREFSWFDRVHFVACDVYEISETVKRLFCESQAVVHLAWPGLPNYAELFHYEKNLPADYRFLKSLVEGGVGHVLAVGTCLEYGMRNGPLSEDMPTAPVNSYALAKDSLRKFLQALQSKRRFVLQWARLFYMYGEGQNPRSLLSQLDKAIDQGEMVFNMSGGEQLRDYLPVQEVAARIVALLGSANSDGIVNICSGQPVSVRKIVECHIAKRDAQLQLNVGYYPYPDYEPMAFWGNPARQNTILGKE